MAALFADFSFEAASRRPICDERSNEDADLEGTTLNVSPTSVMPSAFAPASRLPTPPPCSMGDLAHILDQQSLRITVDTSFQAGDEPLTPPSDDDILFHSQQQLAPSPTHSVSRLNSATLRMQRQANVRMQCSTSHVKDITKLVEMMTAGEQCKICERKPTALSSPIESDEDEGLDMEYTPTGKEQLSAILPCYRAGARDMGARVSKRPRMRRSRVAKASSK